MKCRFTSKQNIHNKGFTLVELIVVLVLMMILIGISVAGILTWQDWSRFKKENTGAETIFYAMQNQLTELSASDAYNDELLRKIQIGATDSMGNDTGVLRVATPDNPNYFGNAGSKVSYEDGKYYLWDDTVSGNGTIIWKNTPSNATAEEKKEYQGSIYRLYANKGDYSTYLSDLERTDGEKTLRAGTRLLFDLISPYISDKSVLNGAIWVEFSPEAAQVFSVCYSDRLDAFSYDGAEGTTSVLDRTENTRRTEQMGYFVAESLSMPLKGRSQKKAGDVSFSNGNTYDLVIKDESGNVTAGRHYTITFYTVSGGELDKDEPLMSMKVKIDASNMTHNSVTMAALNPTETEATFYQGALAGEESEEGTGSSQSSNKKTIYLPVWLKDSDDGKKEIHIVYDAADVQAQSYLCADPNKPEASFVNTFSFYRFGFDMTDSSMQNVGCGVYFGDASEEVESDYEYNTSPVFGKVSTSSGKTQYEIENERHLYNIRFETDYKQDKTERVFLLKNDLNWKTFTNNADGNNYFLNSYSNFRTSGINCDGFDYGINKVESIGESNRFDTAAYAFPGFRSLGINDTFEGNDHTIENLTIAFSANMAYGVYGKTSRDKWLETDEYELGEYGKYDDSTETTLNTDWKNLTEISELDIVGGREKHPCHIEANAGNYPLGFFAENSGTIENLTLKSHKVIGMESIKYFRTTAEKVESEANEKAFVYTNMVGGFTGNNLGILSNLTLGDENDTVTHINGKTDIGGILGRESWSISSSTAENVTLSELYNYGKVTGMENVGGIVGRAYIMRDYTMDPAYASTDEFKSAARLSFRIKQQYYDDGYDIYGDYDIMSDSFGSLVPGTQKSITGNTVYRDKFITIDHCTNRGEVHGDQLIYDGNVVYLLENFFELDDNNLPKRIVLNKDLSNKYLRCANIGGIAGITMDGTIYDFHYPYGRGAGAPGGYNYDYGDESLYKVMVSNCNSYRVSDYAATTAGNLSADVKNQILHDYYVGGLIGYVRLTKVVDCSNKPKTGRAFVFGRSYVGGMFGCLDFAMISDSKTAEYNLVNDANVIGITYVGGIAGGVGIGSADQETLSFKHPSANAGSRPSNIFKANTGYIPVYESLKNTGVVLAVKRSVIETNGLLARQDADVLLENKDGKATNGNNTLTTEKPASGEVRFDAGVGGIFGVSRAIINNCDSIQSDATKTFALSLLGISNPSAGSVTYDNYKNSMYGGDFSGGICGLLVNGQLYCNRNNTRSTVNAVVVGEKAVGGAIGGATEVTTCQNILIDQNSYILGQDMVGGVIGEGVTYKNPLKIIQDKTYTVSGRYGVGGVVGLTKGAAVEGFQIKTDNKIYVRGKAYVGGAAGIYNSQTSLKGSISNSGGDGNTTVPVDVMGEFFTGGIIGAIHTANNNNNLKFSAIEVKSSNLQIESSTMFAGGFAGLYNSAATADTSTVMIDTAMLPRLANRLTGKTGADVIYQIVAESGTGGVLAQKGTFNNSELNFNANAMPINQKLVKAQSFAGGLFGYLPEGLGVTIDCGAGGDNTQKIQTTVQTTTQVDLTSGGLDDGINGLTYAGGIVGRIPYGVTIKKASYIGKLDSQSSYLGEITEVNNGAVSESFVNTLVYRDNANAYIGGLVGLNTYNGSIYGNNRFSNATLRGIRYLGGLTGENRGTMNLGDFDFGDGAAAELTIGPKNGETTVSNAGCAIGLIAGKNSSEIKLSNNTKLSSNKIKGVETVETSAGLVAGINSGTITSTDNTLQTVTGTFNSNNVTYVGMIAGQNSGTISNIKTTGSVSGAANVAGIAGYVLSGSAITNCVNTAELTGQTTMGIAFDGGLGSYTLCRNYAPATYEIAQGAASWSKCLGAGAMHNSQAYCFYIAGNCPDPADAAALFETRALYIRDDTDKYTVGYYELNDQDVKDFKEAFVFDYESFNDMTAETKFSRMDSNYLTWVDTLQ